MTTEELHKLIADVLEHDRRATPGPWFIAYSTVHSEPLTAEYARIEHTIPEDAPEEAYSALPDTGVAYVPVAGGDTPTLQGGMDGALIALYRSAAPQLARKLEEALDREQAMQEALEEFGPGGTNHWRKCFVDDFNKVYARKLEEIKKR